MLNSHAFERTVAPPGGTLQELLVQRGQATWLDLPDRRGRLNFEWDLGAEVGGPFSLAMAAEFPVGGEGSESKSRVIGLGTGGLALNYLVEAPGPNRDFIMNCFNWLAERDFNVRVGYEDEQRTVIDVVRGGEIIILKRFAWYGLPGFLALVGLFLAWRRKH